ncbi:hypothetical protein E5673_08110 [Sphingomonas sp. PAMC26645]|nr:hypothetical protein E5673_08110 [Sphingomonas sp. PAMC26645]
MHQLLFAIATLALVGAPAPAFSTPCKDAKGRFAKCPNKPPPKSVRCKTANGKFAKCGSAGAKPV